MKLHAHGANVVILTPETVDSVSAWLQPGLDLHHTGFRFRWIEHPCILHQVCDVHLRVAVYSKTWNDVSVLPFKHFRWRIDKNYNLRSCHVALR